MVLLVSRPHALEDLDRLFDGRLFHQHRLEAAFERGIPFDVFPVLVEGRRTDALQVAAGQGRLEQVGRVHAAAGRARAHQHVHLVYEEDGIGIGDLFDDLLQALFELAAVHRAGHQRADIQHQDALVHQRLRHIAVDDALRQPLDDGRLADPRLADEGRVVLGAPAQDLDDPLDLLLAADHRIELARLGARGQVEAQLVGEGRLAFPLAGCFFLDLALEDRLGRLHAHAVEINAQAPQHLGRDAFALLHQAEKQVLGADVGMAELARFFDRQFDHMLGAWGKGGLAERRPRIARRHAFDNARDLLGCGAQIAQHTRSQAVLLFHQTQQQMFRANVVMIQPDSFFLRKLQHLARVFREAI